MNMYGVAQHPADFLFVLGADMANRCLSKISLFISIPSSDFLLHIWLTNKKARPFEGRNNAPRPVSLSLVLSSWEHIIYHAQPAQWQTQLNCCGYCGRRCREEILVLLLTFATTFKAKGSCSKKFNFPAIFSIFTCLSPPSAPVVFPLQNC